MPLDFSRERHPAATLTQTEIEMQEQFDGYGAFTRYLVEKGWVAPKDASAVECAAAAFENTQRRRGSDAARAAMDKAARRVW